MECDKRVSDVHVSLFALKLPTHTRFRFVEQVDLCSDEEVNLFRSASFWSLSESLLSFQFAFHISGLSEQVCEDEPGLVYYKHASSNLRSNRQGLVEVKVILSLCLWR